jgi:hypothetical protein
MSISTINYLAREFGLGKEFLTQIKVHFIIRLPFWEEMSCIVLASAEALNICSIVEK